MKVNAADVLVVLNTLGQLAGRAIDAYEQARDLAGKVEGIKPEDLDDADKRWQRKYRDPLDGTGPTVQPVSDLYDRWRNDPGDAMLTTGDHVYNRTEDGMVWINAGGPIHLGFPGGPTHLLRVVG